jgi:ribose 5-phosphate isomerase A
VPFGWKLCAGRLEGLGSTLSLRTDGSSPFVSNNGNYILDCAFAEGIEDPAGMESAINQIPGVVCNGLFIDLADEALVGREDSVEHLRRGG